jgi:hypothetical protein
MCIIEARKDKRKLRMTNTYLPLLAQIQWAEVKAEELRKQGWQVEVILSA